MAVFDFDVYLSLCVLVVAFPVVLASCWSQDQLLQPLEHFTRLGHLHLTDL